jgi:hypothetical protein
MGTNGNVSSGSGWRSKNCEKKNAGAAKQKIAVIILTAAMKSSNWRWYRKMKFTGVRFSGIEQKLIRMKELFCG